MKKERGITLIALVVTIVILLILAGITINMLFGDNGIIKQAEEANRKQAEAGKKELDDIENLKDVFNKVLDGKIEEELDYTKLTPEERFEKMEQMTVQPKLLSYGNEETADMSNPKYFSNSIGWANEDSKDIGEILNCECNQVYNIYKKAKEMGLVETYSTYDSDDRNIITAPIKEPSLVVFYFLCRNINQVPVPVFPVDMSLNYEVRVNNLKNSDWISVSYPAYGTKYGDVETGIMWVGQEFVDLGYVIGEARAYNFPDYTIKRLKQTVEYEWQILTQTNFLKVAQALGLDLSSYHCEHITQ